MDRRRRREDHRWPARLLHGPHERRRSLRHPAGKRARPLERLLASRGGVRVRCTTVRAAEGDSGGPVYTGPRSDGTVRALGITTLVFGLFRQMCFTPIQPVLDRLDATLVTGS